jgi:hypothetical protein
LPSLSSEAWTLDQRSRADVAYGSHQFDVAVGGGVVVCARSGAASARRDGTRNFIFRAVVLCSILSFFLDITPSMEMCRRRRACYTNQKKNYNVESIHLLSRVLGSKIYPPQTYTSVVIPSEPRKNPTCRSKTPLPKLTRSATRYTLVIGDTLRG